MNKVILIGRNTKDPEFSTTTNDTSVVKFTLAVQRKVRDECDFINCVAWRKTAELIRDYVKKGDRIGVVGSLQLRNYDGKDGKKVYVTEVIADEIEFLNDKKQETTEKEIAKPEPIDDNDLPF